MNKLRLVIWFGGIGADCRAFDRAGIGHHIVDCVELDKHAVKSFNLLNNTNFEPKDINDVNVNGYGEVDMLVAGWPCQDLSIAGKQKGLIEGERSSLIWTTIRKINEMKEKPKVILLENVKGLLSEKHKEGFAFIRESFENMGYYFSYKLLNSKFFGVPQNRERVYCVLTLDQPFNWSWSDKFNTVDVSIRDILDKEAEWMIADNFFELGTVVASPPKIYFQNKLSQYKDRLVEVNLNKLHNQNKNEINRVGQLGTLKYDTFETIAFKQDKNFQGEEGVSTTLVATSPQTKCKVMRFEPLLFAQKRHFQGVDGISKTLRAGDCDKEGKILKEKEFQIFYRNLTSSECWKLMGFTEADFDKVKGHISNNQLCKQAGNSIVVNVLVEIFKELYKNSV